MAAVGARRRCQAGVLATATLAPFLYPSLVHHSAARAAGLVTLSPAAPKPFKLSCRSRLANGGHSLRRWASTASEGDDTSSGTTSKVNDLPESRLNPAPDDYAAPTFADRAELTLYAGRGGNGCVSFLREAYLPDGPPNGGDGGAGGNVYIQAAHGETSLHKISRRRFVRAGRGKHGQGSAKSGTRGDDVIITVPVGTIVRELDRQDPAAEEAMSIKEYRVAVKARRRKEIELEDEERRQKKLEKLQQELREQQGEDLLDEDEPHAETEEWEEDLSRRSHARIARHEQLMEEQETEEDEIEDPQRHKWLLYPGMSKNDMKSAEFPPLPRRTRLLQQPAGPIYLDLSRPTPQPILLATGGIGGLGNTHFNSRDHPRPMFATKGDEAVTMSITLELKLLADVGLVGLPNAGKSTLLRAITNSRTRVGNWAFTTLQPNIGTVVLDKYSGRPVIPTTRPLPSVPLGSQPDPEDGPADPRTRFTVADIPGLIEGAHLDKGLGIAFLRHVERAGVLAFVIDLSAGNAVTALKALWREVALYAEMRDEEERSRSAINWDESPDPFQGTVNLMAVSESGHGLAAGGEMTPTMHTAGKPWFVVATKADLPQTRDNFKELKAYLDAVTAGTEAHPIGVEAAWTKRCAAIPVSAINGQGVDRIVRWTVGLLSDEQ